MASAATIAKYKVKAEQAQKRASTLVKRTPLKIRSAQRVGALFGAGAGFAFGALERQGNAPPTFGLNVEPALLYGVAIAGAGEFMSGRLGEYVRSAGHGLLIATAYKAGSTGTTAAGSTPPAAGVSGYGGDIDVFDDPDEGSDEGEF